MKKMHVIIFYDWIFWATLFWVFLSSRSLVLTTACQLFCLDCVMVIKTAISFVIIMNIVTSVWVYPQEGTVETVSKFHLS